MRRGRIKLRWSHGMRGTRTFVTISRSVYTLVPEMNIQLNSYVRERNYDKLMTFLIRGQYDVNRTSEVEGQTALHLACKINDVEIAKALIAFDADVNSINALWKTPLDIVLESDPPNLELKELLVKLDGKRYSDIMHSGDEDCHRGLNQQGDHDYPYTDSEDSQREEEEEHRNVEADGEDYPWSISPPAKKSKAESPTEERERVHPHRHLGLQIQGGPGFHKRGPPRVMKLRSRRDQQNHVTVQRSDHNPSMVVQKSILGESAVHKHLCESMEHMYTTVCDGGEGKGQRILCLDGGGIKGLIQIEMLKTIEQMTGKSISELFDWVVGTSTGGILALGMIYGGLSLVELRQLYFNTKDTVFRQQSRIISCICDTNALEKLLKDMFGTERRMDSIKKPNILIAAVEKSTTSLPLVFFNNCFKNEFSNELVWKVARYTSAAPLFFAECDSYVDGGVKANNPTHFALTEIQDYLSKKHGPKSAAAEISCVVSLGCGEYPPQPLGNVDIAKVLNITRLHLIHQCVNSLWILFKHAFNVSEETVRMTRISCEQQDIVFFRFSPVIGKDVGTTEKDNHKLCDIIIRTKELFTKQNEQVEAMLKELGIIESSRILLP